MVLQSVVGMYQVLDIKMSPTPFDSTVSQQAPEKEAKEVRAR